MRSTSTRWWGISVGSIDPVGILYGLTTQAWIAIASPTATSTVAISSTSDRAVRINSTGRRGAAADPRVEAPGTR